MQGLNGGGIIVVMRKQLLLSLGILGFLALATVMVILYGKGYRFGFGNGRPEVLGTGLLVTTSTPDGAEVLINDHLTTATNNTINLFPGEYDVKIEKDGYFTWEKKIRVQKEVVAKADATLFPTAPQLVSITQTGVISPELDPTMSKVAYTVASQSAKKNGIYVLDLGNHSLISLGSGATQIADDTTAPFSTASLSWSPDGKQLLATISATATKPATTYLLDTGGINQTPEDVSETLPTVKASWDKVADQQTKAQLGTLKKPLATFLEGNWKVLGWSPDETKILYVATASAMLPQIIKPALLGTDSTPEVRILEKNDVYVYDTKEDKNFRIMSATDTKVPEIMWYADSKHLIYAHDKKIDIMEYDGQNRTTVYAGPFIDPFVFPNPSATGIVVLTNLNNAEIVPNLYSIDFK